MKNEPIKLILILVFILIFVLWVFILNNNKKSELKEESEIKKVNDNIETTKKPKNNLFNINEKAPDLIWLENWINSKEIKSLDELKWKVVFIDFWTYSCINCIRTLPYMQDLHEKYWKEWLVILWLHAPEFSYEKKIENLQKAVKKYWLTYKIAQDNDFKTWYNYNNKYWPAQYIIDKKWNLRYYHYWEWSYEKIEEVVQALLDDKN